jgi:uncharacterized protein YndB with AHSA1/START domain
MARIEGSVEIKRPVEHVFAYVTDMNNLSKWVPAMQEVEHTSPGQMGVGTTLKGIYKIMGWRMPWTSKVTEYDLNKKWGESISSGGMLSEELLTFDSTAGGTKFTLLYNMKVGGFLKLLAPLMASSMRKQTKANLAKLKDLLETQVKN